MISKAKLEELRKEYEHPFTRDMQLTPSHFEWRESLDTIETLYAELESKTTALHLEQKLTVGLTINCQELQKKIIALRDENEKLGKVLQEINIAIAHNGQWMKTMSQEPRPTIFFVQDKVVEALAALREGK